MRRFKHSVKSYFDLTFSSLNSALGALFCEGANYSKPTPLPSSLI